MSEVTMPRRRDELEDCLDVWERAIHEWQRAAENAAQEEATFKAWEAATKAAHIGMKKSAVLSEALVRGDPKWAERYLSHQRASVQAEMKKRILRLAEAKWETERSRQVSLRQVR